MIYRQLTERAVTISYIFVRVDGHGEQLIALDCCNIDG